METEWKRENVRLELIVGEPERITVIHSLLFICNINHNPRLHIAATDTILNK